MTDRRPIKGEPSIVTIGEALFRLSVPEGERLEDARHIAIGVAGSEANVAVALANLGMASIWISRLPDTRLGRRVADDIARFGVDVSHVVWTEKGRVGLFFVELSVPPRPAQVIYDRRDTAAAAMSISDVPRDLIESAALLHLSGITPALSDTTRQMAAEVVGCARRGGTLVSIDVNHRSLLWTAEMARAVLLELCESADLLIATRADARDIFGVDGENRGVAEHLTEVTGVARVVVTRGANGVVWNEPDGGGELPVVPATVVDRIGAGDAFAAGVIKGFVEGDLEQGVELGLVLAALKLGIRGDQLRLSPADVRLIRDGVPREVLR
jgi:2-dehydro-3-deoxygluconokinase